MYLGKDPTNFLLNELVVFALHCEIQRICNGKKPQLTSCLKHSFCILPKLTLPYDFIYSDFHNSRGNVLSKGRTPKL